MNNIIYSRPNRPAKTVDEARDLWCRICNLMDWLREGKPPIKMPLSYPKKYRENLYKFLGYWRHTPNGIRQSAKVITRVNGRL